MYTVSTSTCSPPPSCRKICFAIHPFLGRIWKRPQVTSSQVGRKQWRHFIVVFFFVGNIFWDIFCMFQPNLGGKVSTNYVWNGWKMVDVETQNCLSWNILQRSLENVCAVFWLQKIPQYFDPMMRQIIIASCLTKVSLDVVSLSKIVLLEYHHVTALQKHSVDHPKKFGPTSYPNFVPLRNWWMDLKAVS